MLQPLHLWILKPVGYCRQCMRRKWRTSTREAMSFTLGYGAVMMKRDRDRAEEGTGVWQREMCSTGVELRYCGQQWAVYVFHINMLSDGAVSCSGSALVSYMVASKYSRNHPISEKYETVQSFKLHFLQNSQLEQLYTSGSNRRSVGNIHGNHFVKTYSALPSHSWLCQ